MDKLNNKYQKIYSKAQIQAKTAIASIEPFLIFYMVTKSIYEIRQKIYEDAKNHKNGIKEFFLEDVTDQIIVNIKILHIMKKLKKIIFGDKLLKQDRLFSNLYNVNISIYILQKRNQMNFIIILPIQGKMIILKII